MNDIIKNIEAEQLKEQAPEFHVGYTERSKKALARESRYLREPY